ncbi:MAG: alginate lyase family protein [Bacteroidales bacterium]|nr:alginate lyase family protein [Bacteroidales bacterium]
MIRHLLTLALLCSSVLAWGQTFVAVTDKETSQSGNKHNFESLSIYWWPNPDSADGLPYFERDGEWNPEYKLYDFPRLLKLVDNLHSFNRNYPQDKTANYKAFCKQIDIWFLDSKTRMAPNFTYCQFVPGRNNGEGFAGGIIDAYNFITVLDELETMTRQKSVGWLRELRLRLWFKDFMKWMLTSSQGKEEAARTNNHGLAYDIILYRFAHFTKQPELCTSLVPRITQRIHAQIQADGRQPEELKRTRAFFYSAYNLEHMVDFCVMMHNSGNNYIDQEGSRVKEALLFLAPYLSDHFSWPYQEIGSWQECENILRNQIRRCQAISNDPRLKSLSL